MSPSLLFAWGILGGTLMTLLSGDGRPIVPRDDPDRSLLKPVHPTRRDHVAHARHPLCRPPTRGLG